jgi:hypothetical protein
VITTADGTLSWLPYTNSSGGELTFHYKTSLVKVTEDNGARRRLMVEEWPEGDDDDEYERDWDGMGRYSGITASRIRSHGESG